MVLQTRNTQPRLLTTKQAAKILNVHENTVRRWSEKGIIKSFRVGPRADRRFYESEIIETKLRIERQAGDVRLRYHSS
jgi:excisionase family DNA binding protein